MESRRRVRLVDDDGSSTVGKFDVLVSLVLELLLGVGVGGCPDETVALRGGRAWERRGGLERGK